MFSAGFIWDDDLHLINNIILLPEGLYRVWILREGLNWWPVAFTSYWIEYQLWGMEPAGYHAVNVAIHTACALLSWRILVRLGIPGSVAVLAAALFALHPQNVETVAWIAQRKGLLSMFFALASVHAVLRFDDGLAQGGGSRAWVWYGWGLVSLVLGMLAKGSIAPLPFVLLLALAWRRPLTRADLWRLAPFLALAVLLASSEVFGQQLAAGAESVRDDSLAGRMAAAGWIAWFYVGKTLAPVQLTFAYPRWAVDPANWVHWLPTLAAVAALAVPASLWRRGGPHSDAARAVTFALAFYALMIFPALGFANFYYLRYSLVADHYQYFAQIGILALVAAGLGRLTRSQPLAFVGVAVVLLLSLGILTHHQSRIYESEETVWRDTLAKNPTSSIALNNLGRIVAMRGDFAEAGELFVRAAEADPGNREAWRNAGVAADLQGDRAQALAHLRRAIANWPGAGASAAELAALDLAAAHRWLGELAARSYQAPVADFHRQRAAQLEAERPAGANLEQGAGLSPPRAGARGR